MSNPFLSLAMVACFDGEQPADEAPVTGTQADEMQDAQPVEETPETPEPEPLTFTEADLEQRIAERLAERDAEWKNQLGAKDSELNEIRAKFDSVTIERSLADAAKAGDAFNSEVILAYLRPFTRVNDGAAVIEIEGFTLSAAEAVQWMRAQVDRFGCLFKTNVIPGIGSHSSAGGARAPKGMDVRHMDAGTYRKVRRENPESLGLGGVG